MLPFLRGRKKKTGWPPGTIEPIEEGKVVPPKISAFIYSKTKVNEFQELSLEKCLEIAENKNETIWINIEGLGDPKIIEEIGKKFKIHPLILEDICTPIQRPKVEEFEDYIYIVLRPLFYENTELQVDQISFILGKNFLITFQEFPGDEFEGIRIRLRNVQEKITSEGPDYLCYRLIDAIVDNYFSILESIGEKVEILEEELVRSPSNEVLAEVRETKNDMIIVRRAVWPLREVINILLRSESSLIKKTTKTYLRDLYDHTIQAMEAAETYREITSEMIGIYLSSTSNRTNEIMRVLTVISTIFIPITFLVGVYGMNFHYMPELSWKYGYAFTWLIILTSVTGMLFYFKKRKWI